MTAVARINARLLGNKKNTAEVDVAVKPFPRNRGLTLLSRLLDSDTPDSSQAASASLGTQFTRFTGTKVRILTQTALKACAAEERAGGVSGVRARNGGGGGFLSSGGIILSFVRGRVGVGCVYRWAEACFARTCGWGRGGGGVGHALGGEARDVAGRGVAGGGGSRSRGGGCKVRLEDGGLVSAVRGAW